MSLFHFSPSFFFNFIVLWSASCALARIHSHRVLQVSHTRRHIIFVATPTYRRRGAVAVVGVTKGKERKKNPSKLFDEVCWLLAFYPELLCLFFSSRFVRNSNSGTMAHLQRPQEIFTPEELDLRVRQGLQKRKKCALCTQIFYVNELPGAITHKSILELRRKWGMDVRRGDHMPPPSQLYKREEICIFCMQFFDTTGSMQTRQKLLASTRDGISPALTLRWGTGSACMFRDRCCVVCWEGTGKKRKRVGKSSVDEVTHFFFFKKLLFHYFSFSLL